MTTTNSYVQDFNTLKTSGAAAWGNNSTLVNWYATSFNSSYSAEDGSLNSGGLKSYGTGVNTDRALGSLGSSNANPAYGVVLRNTSGVTITDIKVTYTGEQWRNGGVTATQSLAFYYATSSSAITSVNAGASGYTAVPALNFTSKIGTTTAAALDGNVAENRTTISNVSIPNLSLANNSYIIIKWDDINDTGNDHGLAIDDLTISWTVTPANSAPTATSVAVSGADLLVGTQLTGSYTYSDAENNSEGTSTFKWYRANDNTGSGSTAISDATSQTYTLTTDDLGKYVRFGVVPVATTGTLTGTETFSAWNGPITSTSPFVTASGTLAALTTTYGTASTTTSFTVNAGNLTNDLIITAPAGFHVSENATSGFASTINLGSGVQTGKVIYVRLTATTAAGSYSGNVSLQSGATTTTVATANSTVNKRGLTITGLTPQNKIYDGNVNVTVNGTATYSGLVNGEETVYTSATGTVTWAFPNKTQGVNKTLTRTGNYDVPSNNYTVTQPTLTATISKKDLNITGATAQNKVYNANTTATIIGATPSLTDLVSGDVVSVSGGGTFASANVADNISVTAALTLGGTDAVNYTIIQPTGLTANITKATLTATADNKSKATGAVNPVLTITYNGFVGGQTAATALNFIAPSATTNATDASPAGNYQITLSGGSAANYNFTLVNGILTVKDIYNGSGVFQRITSLNDLEDGYYVIVGNGTNAMNTTVNTNAKLEKTTVTVTDNKVTNPALNIVWKIETVSGNIKTIYNDQVEAYVTGSGINNTDVSLAASVTNNNGRWGASIVNSLFRFINQTQTGRALWYNGTVFSQYATSNSTGYYDLALYKLLPPPAVLSVSTTSLTGLNYTAGNGPSAAQSFVVSGENLTGDVTVLADGVKFEISENETSGYTDEITLTTYNGSNKTIWVRSKAGQSIGTKDEIVLISGGGAAEDKEVSLTGIVIAPPVSITSPACGSILNYRNASISCNSVSVEGYTVQYLFRIQNENFNASVLRDVPNFTILQASYAAYVHPAATTYSVYVSLVVNGEPQPESEVACAISVPAVAAPGQSLSNCNTVLTTPSTLVFASGVSGAVEYQFEISQGGNVVALLTQPYNYFHSSTDFTGWNYGTTFSVRMKARKSNESFEQLAFGTACNLTYPAIPAQAQALVNCTNTLPTVSRLVFTPSVFGATSYRFELNDGTTTYTVTRPNAYFHFTTDFAQWNYGKTYSVRVQVARNNDVYGPWSTNSCVLTSPAMPAPAQGLVNCTTVMTSPTSLLFAPSVFGATDYQFVVTIPGTYFGQFEKAVPYFRLTDVPGWIAGTTYTVTVKAIRNGVESGTSSACTFTTPGVAPVASSPVARVAEVPFAVKAYPNPYSNAFQLDVASTDKTALVDVKVFDMLGRMVENKNTTVGDLQTTTLGSDYPSGVYNVIVTQGNDTKVVRVVKR